MLVHITLSELKIKLESCPICGPSVFIKLAAEEMAIRCIRCRASPVSLSLVAALQRVRPNLKQLSVYELSSRGPVVSYLKRHCSRLQVSEFFEGFVPGARNNNVECQDVQRLTFADSSFDVSTSTEVFEHVPDDLQGFAEVRRVLRPNGVMLFTVPLSSATQTVTRAEIRNGIITHLLTPEYHGDRIRGTGKVLVFRDYGQDVLQRVLSAGFSNAEFILPNNNVVFGFARTVIAAYK
jgi:SAM-dependent methyltransferase